MGLFGGKSEDDLRTTGAPTTARVTYVDDTGKRRNGRHRGQGQVPRADRLGHRRAGASSRRPSGCRSRGCRASATTISIRIDPDDADDWAWGDAAMYEPARLSAQPPAPGTAMTTGAPGMPAAPQGADPMTAYIQQAMGPWGDIPGMQKMIESAMSMGQAQVSINEAHWMNATDPETREQIMLALQNAGMDVSQMPGQGPTPGYGSASPSSPSPPAAAPGSGDDTAERLRKLDKLLEQGLVTPDEHRELRQKIIDSI